MDNLDRDYILLNTQNFQSLIWDDNQPFDKRSAWVDLMLSANDEPKTEHMRGQLITLERGQLYIRPNKLAKRWRWSEGKVKRFLEFLAVCDAIRIDSDCHGTIITLLGWDM